MNSWAEDVGLLYRQTMETEQMMACLLVEIRSNQEMLAKLETKVDINLRGMMAEIRTSLERMEAKIEPNNEKFEAL
jgi:hypothetical protein